MPQYENIFARIDDFYDLSIKYNLEDCGMSGQFVGYHWYVEDEAEVNVYIG